MLLPVQTTKVLEYLCETRKLDALQSAHGNQVHLEFYLKSNMSPKSVWRLELAGEARIYESWFNFVISLRRQRPCL